MIKKGVNRWVFLVVALGVSLGLLLSSPPAQAASAKYSLSPGSASVTVGGTFTVTVNLTTDTAINAGGGKLIFPGSLVQATSVSASGSIFSTWPSFPAISGQTIPFQGGLPNPGFKGTGKIFSATFKATAAGTASLTVAEGQILENSQNATDLYSGTNTVVVTINDTFPGPSIASTSHPDPSKWYNNKNLALSWNKASRVNSFTYSLDGPSGTVKSGPTTDTSISFPNLADGSYTFSLTAVYSDGQGKSSFKAQIDTTPPDPFTVKITSGGNTDPFPVLSYSATDKLSGIDHYEISVDTDAAISTTDLSYKLPRQRPGSHKITVRAVDKAGNSTDGTTAPGLGQFSIEGFPGPTITKFPGFVATLQPITFVGQALLNTTVHLYVDGKDSAQFVVRENLSDAERQKHDVSTLADDQTVEWSYTYKGVLWPGSHHFDAIQVKPDTAESNPSNTVTVRVLAGTITIGGIIIPMAFLLILALLILIALSTEIIYLFRHTRGKYIDWRRRLQGIKGQIDNELDHLGKKLDTDVDQSVDHAKTLRREVTSEVEKAQTAIDQSIDILTNEAKPVQK